MGVKDQLRDLEDKVNRGLKRPIVKWRNLKSKRIVP